MKKFLLALIVAGSLFVTSTSYAAIETFTGTDEYTLGENETQAAAKERSRQRAMRNAQEQAGILIKSRSRSIDLELVDDEIITIAAGVIKVVGAPVYKVRVLDDGKSTVIFTTLTVKIDTDDVDRRLQEIEARDKKVLPPFDSVIDISTITPAMSGTTKDVRGIVTSLYEKKGTVYFTLKDISGQATINGVLFAKTNNDAPERKKVLLKSRDNNSVVYIKGKIDIYKGKLEIKTWQVYDS